MSPMRGRANAHLRFRGSHRAHAGRRVAWEGRYRLAEAPEGTRVSQQGTLSFGGMWRLAEPIVGAEVKRREIKELEKLKAIVERS